MIKSTDLSATNQLKFNQLDSLNQNNLQAVRKIIKTKTNKKMSNMKTTIELKVT